MNQPTDLPDLERWQSLYGDQAALIKNPRAHQRKLIELANALHARGVLDSGDLADRLEQADAAYSWGIEESAHA